MTLKNKSITLFVVDDNIPTRKDFVDKGIYNSKIEKKEMSVLINTEDWKGEYDLFSLIKNIFESELEKNIEILGFKHPEICIKEIESNLSPDIVIYDWEYGHQIQNSGGWLFTILEKSHAFVFVYSAVKNLIPPFLNKKEFDKYSFRFQLFSKGDKKSSIFSSEEFVLQYILSRIKADNTIKIMGVDVKFTASGYLAESSDILYLENILGGKYLLEKLKEAKYTLDNKSVEKLLKDAGGKIYLSANKRFIIASDAQLLMESFKPIDEYSYLQIVEKYGLIKLQEALEAGIAKII